MSLISNFLQRSNTVVFVIYASSAAFMTYFCMYAFRKPFSVGKFEQVDAFMGVLDFKIALVLAQVFGYLLSKFIGIKVVSELTANRRAAALLSLVLVAQFALVLFALVPEPFKPLMMFLNGVPLGMIWGIVFSFLEGRKTSEILGAFLSVTFIVASGLVRTVGQWLILELNVTEYWMPAATGAIFTVPLFLSVYFLAQTPPPSTSDKAARQARAPMNGEQRLAFFLRYAPGILLLITSFLLFTGLRDFRDNFSAEIWQALGHGEEPAIFAYAGIRIAGVVLLVLAAMVMIKNNTNAFLSNHGFILLGCVLLGGTTYAFEQQWIDGKTWMVWLGAGLYIAYIPYNCFLFDRMISAVGSTANAGFLIYLADSAGYLGSVSMLLYRTFASPDISWLEFFIHLCYLVAILGGALVMASMGYFSIRLLRNKPSSQTPRPEDNTRPLASKPKELSANTRQLIYKENT
ncbi:DUF5690 family protein [Pseudoalteromonas sp. Of7M-16]|uniref:DUF5690 family protein n=1 Tax=Pseudoalteromonas sp. Of7M-16 TaxID=2917756 RepID=UPI001EF53029|nr:DUF5690 family protein [Pseudoalteromonas sp. Of7M-16]MCG7546420.1 DUF5690 family protein [Pseudoalteromonas sp. Of7M-16]